VFFFISVKKFEPIFVGLRGEMTKSEQRIKNFSSGLKKLGNDNQDYIRMLIGDLFLIEKFPACQALAKKSWESHEKRSYYEKSN